MLHHAAFHPGLHCVPKYPFRVSSVQRFMLHVSTVLGNIMGGYAKGLSDFPRLW